MLNYDTLLSSYDDKLTLMQWLKKVEEALKDASAVSFNVNKRGDATLTFSIKFEDGSEIESGPFTLEQGESVESAYIVNGNLHLVLTNGDDLDAGNMFNGDLNVNGKLTTTGNVEAGGDLKGASASINGGGTFGGAVVAASFSGDNAKPIYCHPIVFNNAAKSIKVGCLIFNNTQTALTMSTFLDFIDALFLSLGGTVRIVTTGGGSADGSIFINAFMGKKTEGYYINGVTIAGADFDKVYTREDMISDFGPYFRDGVNKIN